GDRFRTGLARARHARRGDPRIDALLTDLHGQRRYSARVAVRVGEKFVVIRWQDVDWIEAADNYVKLHAGSRDFLLRETLSSLEQQLDPERFVRIDRSTMVLVDRIA